MQRICVFAGSQLGSRPEYEQAALDTGRELVARGLGLVYAGAGRGLVAAVARAVLSGGRAVVGVVAHGGSPCGGHDGPLTKLYRVGSVAERTTLMAELADGFIALPGGVGTFDEIFTLINWGQSGLHSKPIGFLNAAGYFTPVLDQVARATTDGFIFSGCGAFLFHETEAVPLLECLCGYAARKEAFPR